MADLKIKPSTGAGNKLILESQDGTDVLTTSDSGVTLASATLTANCTFPAGHVLQVASNDSNSQATMTGNAGATATYCTCGITGVTAGNHIFISGQYTYDLRAGANSTSVGSAQYLYHSTTSGGTFTVLANAALDNRINVLNMDDDAHYISTLSGVNSFSFLDEDPGAGEHHYKIYATQNGGTDGILYIPQNTSSLVVMTLMEVQA